MCLVDGCINRTHAKGLCLKHYMRQQRTGSTECTRTPGGYQRRIPGEPRYLDKQSGYVSTWDPDHPHASPSTGYVLEHVYVMTNHLGRRLYPDENVHHKNGDRADNRLTNLELWSTKQPPGQRVEDKVAWAKEILARYG